MCEQARKHICVNDRHDMTLAVKVALNLNTANKIWSKSKHGLNIWKDYQHFHLFL